MRRWWLVFGLVFVVVLVLVGLVVWRGKQLVEVTKVGVDEAQYVCPVEGEDCGTERVIEREGEYVGLGYSLPPGREIVSQFGADEVKVGTMYVGNAGETEKYWWVELVGEDMTVRYISPERFGDLIGAKEKGAVLGVVGEKTMGAWGEGVNLGVVFRDREGDVLEWQGEGVK